MEFYKIARVVRGIQYTKDNRESNEGLEEKLMFYMTDVLNYEENLNLEDTVKIKEDEKNRKLYVDLRMRASEQCVRSGDIIIPSKKREYEVKFIKTSDDIINQYIYTSDIIIVRPVQELVEPEYLFHLMRTKSFEQKVEAIKQVTNDRIKCNMLEQLEVNLPDRTEQMKKLEQIRQIDKEIFNFRNKRDKIYEEIS